MEYKKDISKYNSSYIRSYVISPKSNIYIIAVIYIPNTIYDSSHIIGTLSFSFSFSLII